RANRRHALALRFGSVLSLFLEHQIDRLAPSGGFGMVVVPPSTRPVVANSLARVREEGWWAPELSPDVVRVKAGFPRQRARPGRDRAQVEGKWIVDEEGVAGQEIL